MQEKHYGSVGGERAVAFGEGWLWVAGGVVLLAGLAGQAPLVVLGALTLVTIAAARYWNRHSLDAVEYTRTFDESRCFPDEPVTLRLRVANRKLLPLPFLEVEDEVPGELEAISGARQPTGRPNLFALVNSTSLLSYEAVTWRYRLAAARRGYYRIGPAHLRSGDLFGFFRREATVESRAHLIVYPRIVPLARLGIPSRQPLGERKSPQRIFEDPARTIGVRDYTRDDSFRRIHWKASARASTAGARSPLQVKVYEPTTTPTALIFLSVDTFAYRFQGYDAELLEATITAAASVAAHFLAERHAVGLYANAAVAESDQDVKLAPRRDPDQLGHILETLARIVPMSTRAIDELIAAESGRLPWGATLVVCTGYVSDALAVMLQRLRTRGHTISLLYMGDASPGEAFRGIDIHAIAAPALAAVGVTLPDRGPDGTSASGNTPPPKRPFSGPAAAGYRASGRPRTTTGASRDPSPDGVGGGPPVRRSARQERDA